MLTDRSGVGEWGFSALVETDGRRILFDTGARPETVLQNARELKIDLSDVTDVILSHHHGDHVGGLVTLRRELAKKNPVALKRAYVGAGIFLRNVPETTSLFSRNMLSSPPLGAKQGGGQHGRLCTGNRTEDEAAL